MSGRTVPPVPDFPRTRCPGAGFPKGLPRIDCQGTGCFVKVTLVARNAPADLHCESRRRRRLMGVGPVDPARVDPPGGNSRAGNSRAGASGDGAPARARLPLARRLVPLAVLLAVLAAALVLRPDRYLSFEQLAAHREWLLAEVARLGLIAPVLFLLLYASATGLSIPGATVLTLAGGFLFGTLAGTAIVVVGATLGAVIIFLVARTAFGDVLRARAGPFIRKLEAGFRANALSYLLVLRLVPLFPFWLVNLVPAFLGVRLSTFVIGTFIGIIPGAVVYASLGSGLGALIEHGERPDLGVIFEPRVLTPLVGLAILALLPVAYKWLHQRRTPAGSAE